ncbi:hypothetical protein EK904_000436 [Melospiza melodia maxima]|nr:hypothetical protein EK904_000436 [Melospiza melodia maxima]
MTKARLLRLSVVLVSIFMILLIIVYWDNVGTAHFYLHTSFSRPHSPGAIAAGEDWETLPDVDEFLAKLLSSSLKQNSSIPRKTEQLLVQGSNKPVVSNLEENVRGYDWSTHKDRNSLDQEKLQFWRRYGKFSRHLMKIKLKKYTKFLFVRDPFVRLISAFRSKFELENEDFYRRFAIPMLKLYSNHTNLPTSVSEAFGAGLKVSFSDFIQYLLDPRTEKMAPFNEHWRQVYRLCHPCQIDYDFIGKLETLDEDAAYLLQLLKVDRLLRFPPSYRNRTASSWEDNWFAKIPLAWRQQLYKLYEADFVLFGYPKPENLLKD